ncbi:hypothetical protein CISG_10002 [Coccidioides immitis RMSCC 3703]|uniref:Uncharacterized protein n=2 Tax=Coccidioides immitis TaxID=5501 RepID=A0A0J8QLK6_COCIT|nr:hypothetical protein CIRG_01964 [Coccidioides immitis RMSCC 2394]KMU73286.1 hypothetical protein CISG_10002 [Coccidioides immitis RMSCC 3703]
MDIEPASAPLPSRDIYQMNGCLQASDCSRWTDWHPKYQGEHSRSRNSDQILCWLPSSHKIRAVYSLWDNRHGQHRRQYPYLQWLPPLPPNPTPLFEPIMANDVLGIWECVKNEKWIQLFEFHAEEAAGSKYKGYLARVEKPRSVSYESGSGVCRT